MRARSWRLGLAGALVLALVAGMYLWRQRGADDEAQARRPAADSSKPAPAASRVESALQPAPPLIGERILKDYGDAARPPEEDLMWMARMLENFALLVKGDNPLPLGANEEIANALRGRNRAGLRGLPDRHPAFNDRGQIVDRWGTPLYFHARSRDRLDIRSAGPDRQMWTADDLHRQPNGRFLRGEALLAPSLFDESKDAR